MTNKDERTGILSKVAMFVRNPTKDWSELKRLGQTDVDADDDPVVKGTVERQRHNDYVRKREFDHLRKVRSMDSAAVASLERPSLFHTSLPTFAQARESTLRKIDEIESQMSKQWWKDRREATVAEPGALEAHAGLASPEGGNALLLATPKSMSSPSERFEPTRPFALQPDELAASAVRGNAAAMDTLPSSAYGDSSFAGAGAPTTNISGLGAPGAPFSASGLMGLGRNGTVLDPELEEAAIRFANGDTAGAEATLLSALGSRQAAPGVALGWVGALLDLYRVTHDPVKFAGAVKDYAPQLGAVVPVWAALDSGLQGPARGGGAEGAGHDCIWNSPVELTAQSMESLVATLASHSMPWRLGWTLLERINADAVGMLHHLFERLCNEPLQVQFAGTGRLVSALRALTPEGDSSVPALAWHTRLKGLCAMRMQDDFELASLYYCLANEFPPEPWLVARCAFEDLTPAQSEQAAGHGLALHGQLLGSARQALEILDRAATPGQPVIVNCEFLLRIDFAAGGEILNWAVQRQARGTPVQLRQVHRLVAAFFQVLGLHEHATVMPRSL